MPRLTGKILPVTRIAAQNQIHPVTSTESHCIEKAQMQRQRHWHTSTRKGKGAKTQKQRHTHRGTGRDARQKSTNQSTQQTQHSVAQQSHRGIASQRVIKLRVGLKLLAVLVGRLLQSHWQFRTWCVATARVPCRLRSSAQVGHLLICKIHPVRHM